MQQKTMLTALIVICITIVVMALVARKDFCEVQTRTGQTEVAVSIAYEPEEQETRRGRNSSSPLMNQASSTHPYLTNFGGYILSVSIFIKIMPTHSMKQKVLRIERERNVQTCCFPYLLTLI